MHDGVVHFKGVGFFQASVARFGLLVVLHFYVGVTIFGKSA